MNCGKVGGCKALRKSAPPSPQEGAVAESEGEVGAEVEAGAEVGPGPGEDVASKCRAQGLVACHSQRDWGTKGHTDSSRAHRTRRCRWPL